MSGLDDFWSIIDAQLAELRVAASADDVMSILSTKGRHADSGFFGGSGGDEQVCDALGVAGWRYVWSEAVYFWCMKAPDGSMITYVEGDVYRGDNHRPLPANLPQEDRS